MQSLLILSRTDGSIIQATGAIARTPAAAAGDEDADDSLEKYATVVYRHVKATEEMAKGLEEVEISSRPEQEGGNAEEDDVKLVRVRTKRRELVIVPGELASHFISEGEILGG